jgi:hypothetical protein
MHSLSEATKQVLATELSIIGALTLLRESCPPTSSTTVTFILGRLPLDPAKVAMCLSLCLVPLSYPQQRGVPMWFLKWKPFAASSESKLGVQAEDREATHPEAGIEGQYKALSPTLGLSS